MISGRPPAGAKTSPAIRTVTCLPPEVSVYVSPTAAPVAVRKGVFTSACAPCPVPAYQCPVTSVYPVQLASPPKAVS